MQFSTVILAFAAAVSAAPGPSLISIHGLQIGSFAGSHDASYKANVSYTGQSGYSSLSLPSNNFSDVCKSSPYGYAPSIDGFEHQSFDNPAFAWAVIKNAGQDNGYVLNVNWTSAEGEVYKGSRAIPASDFACAGQSDEHAQDAQFYTGPSNFTLAVTVN